MEEEIDLIEILKIFWRKKIQIIIIILLFTGIGVLYTKKMVTPIYKASTTLVLTSLNSQNNKTNTITSTDITVNSKLVSTYSELIKSKNILDEVISNLGIDIKEEDLKNNITVNYIENTELIQINVKDTDPTNSTRIANEVANVFIKKISELYNINNIQIVNEAQIPSSPDNINNKKYIYIFTLIGVILSVSYAIISNILDTTVKTTDELEKMFKLPILAAIPINLIKGKNKNAKIGYKELVVHQNPKSPISETFRTLRANIQFMNIKKELKTILVTSTLPGEGKSWISSNLAISFAQAGKKVVLIDTDMRKGRQYTIFNILPKPGLSNYLSMIGVNNTVNDANETSKYIQETEIENLHVISAGNIPPNPSELLTSDRMKELLEKLKESFDFIIIDGTPCDLVTDSLILTGMVDSTIVVVAHKQTKKENLKKVLNSIKNVGGKNIGVILNKIPISAKKYEETYYYGSTDDN